MNTITYIILSERIQSQSPVTNVHFKNSQASFVEEPKIFTDYYISVLSTNVEASQNFQRPTVTFPASSQCPTVLNLTRGAGKDNCPELMIGQDAGTAFYTVTRKPSLPLDTCVQSSSSDSLRFEQLMRVLYTGAIYSYTGLSRRFDRVLLVRQELYEQLHPYL